MTAPIAFVLLEAVCSLDENAVVDTLRQRHPDMRWEVAAGSKRSKPDDPLAIRGGDHLFSVMMMPAPLPYDEFVWKRAAIVWPEAASAGERHQAHLVVATVGSAETNPAKAAPTTLEQARVTTALAGALVALLPNCCAVVWDIGVARSRQQWLDDSRLAFAPYPQQHPFALWIDVIPFASAPTATTVGLHKFIYREIEYDDVRGLDLPRLIDRVARTAYYLIEHGLRGGIRNGSVLNGDDGANDRVKVRARISRFSVKPALAIGPEQEASTPKTYPIIPATVAKSHPLLVMLSKAGLFDAAGPENQIELWPHHYVSETRHDSYDSGMSSVFSRMLATDAYAEADETARHTLASGDTEKAKSALMPFATEVSEFLVTARVALSNGDLWMFMPRQPAPRAL
jgi:hypothetical protein